MITFRYHIASLVAVLLALAAGIALGAGPLQREELEPTASDTGSTTSPTAAQEQRSAFNDAFAGSLTADLITGDLTGRSVTLLVLPGAPQEQVAALTSALGVSGASVAGAVQIDEQLLTATNKQLVDELGGQLEAGATKVQVAAGASSYERIGTLLGYAVGTTTAAGDAVDEQATAILTGLSAAGLISTEQTPQRRGNLLLVVAPAPSGDQDSDEGTASIVLSLVRALDTGTGGVVLAGPTSAADADGVLTAVRQDVTTSKAVSTVDSADSPAGAIVTVLALAEQAAQAAGHYGGGAGTTGPRPGVSANN